MLNIAICDDNNYIVEEIKNKITIFLSTFGYEFDIKCFNCGEDLIREDKVECFSIIFLDIKMKRMNGLTAAKKIREHNKLSKIIFITNHSEFIKQSLLVRAFAFLEKPIKNDELYQNTLEAIEYYQAKVKPINFEIKTTIGNKLVDLNNIIYFAFDDRRISVITTNQELHMYNTITKLAEELSQYDFVSPHKAFLVNLKYVSHIRNNLVYLQNDKNLYEVPLSRKRTIVFREAIVDYINKIEVSRL